MYPPPRSAERWVVGRHRWGWGWRGGWLTDSGQRSFPCSSPISPDSGWVCVCVVRRKFPQDSGAHTREFEGKIHSHPFVGPFMPPFHWLDLGIDASLAVQCVERTRSTPVPAVVQLYPPSPHPPNCSLSRYYTHARAWQQPHTHNHSLPLTLYRCHLADRVRTAVCTVMHWEEHEVVEETKGSKAE